MLLRREKNWSTNTTFNQNNSPQINYWKSLTRHLVDNRGNQHDPVGNNTEAIDRTGVCFAISRNGTTLNLIRTTRYAIRPPRRTILKLIENLKSRLSYS